MRSGVALVMRVVVLNFVAGQTGLLDMEGCVVEFEEGQQCGRVVFFDCGGHSTKEGGGQDVQDEVARDVAEALTEKGKEAEVFLAPGLASKEVFRDMTGGESAGKDWAVAGANYADALDEVAGSVLLELVRPEPGEVG